VSHTYAAADDAAALQADFLLSEAAADETTAALQAELLLSEAAREQELWDIGRELRGAKLLIQAARRSRQRETGLSGLEAASREAQRDFELELPPSPPSPPPFPSAPLRVADQRAGTERAPTTAMTRLHPKASLPAVQPLAAASTASSLAAAPPHAACSSSSRCRADAGGQRADPAAPASAPASDLLARKLWLWSDGDDHDHDAGAKDRSAHGAQGAYGAPRGSVAREAGVAAALVRWCHVHESMCLAAALQSVAAAVAR